MHTPIRCTYTPEQEAAMEDASRRLVAAREAGAEYWRRVEAFRAIAQADFAAYDGSSAEKVADRVAYAIEKVEQAEASIPTETEEVDR